MRLNYVTTFTVFASAVCQFFNPIDKIAEIYFEAQYEALIQSTLPQIQSYFWWGPVQIVVGELFLSTQIGEQIWRSYPVQYMVGQATNNVFRFLGYGTDLINRVANFFAQQIVAYINLALPYPWKRKQLGPSEKLSDTKFKDRVANSTRSEFLFITHTSSEQEVSTILQFIVIFGSERVVNHIVL